MGHTFDADRAGVLEDVSRYRFLSRDELVAAIEPGRSDRVLDLGSGTGFYTRDVAAHAGRVFGVDIQSAMHDYHRRTGVPDRVDLVTADVGTLPFAAGTFDGAVSTMTFHEFASIETLRAIADVLRPGARLVTVDWSAGGTGDAGPPLQDRYTLEAAVELLEAAGYRLVCRSDRPETFLTVATAPD